MVDTQLIRTALLFLSAAFYIMAVLRYTAKGHPEIPEKLKKLLPVSALALAGIVCILLAFYRLPTVDVKWYFSWAQTINKYGIGNFYGNPQAMEEVYLGIANYPPFYMYILSFCDTIVQLLGFDYIQNPRACGLIFKLPGILTHLTAGWCVYHYASVRINKSFAQWAMVIFLFAPHSLYNTAIWGQTDEMFAFLSVISLYILSKGKPVIACAIFGLLIAFKPQAIFFAPVYIFWALSQKKHTKYLAVGPLISFITALLVSYPFLQTLNPMALADFYFQSHQTSLSIYAANVYGLFCSGLRLTETASSLLQYIMYALSAAIAGILYFIGSRDETRRVMLSAACCAMLCFMVLPFMHERYLYLALFPLFFMWISTGSVYFFKAFALLGLCCFLNMFVVLNGNLFGSVSYGSATWMTAFRLVSMLTLTVYGWIIYRGRILLPSQKAIAK